SCSGRRYAEIAQGNLESTYIKAHLPAGLALSGYYGHSEISPVRDRDGRIFNRNHSYSLSMCAL
ncbi:MAG: hypothetical protein LBV21_05890, partial [Candidatus Adiutrix sp.]|nr:hypothetical protein [Candidatus Adiutrix sp.]